LFFQISRTSFSARFFTLNSLPCCGLNRESAVLIAAPIDREKTSDVSHDSLSQDSVDEPAEKSVNHKALHDAVGRDGPLNLALELWHLEQLTGLQVEAALAWVQFASLPACVLQRPEWQLGR
jgi:hypothetical protein